MIAEALGCDEKTLRKYFSRELSSGQLFIEGMCLDVLMQKMRQGHTPSAHRLMQRLDRVAVPSAPGKAKPKGKDMADAITGKKDAALKDASRPDDDYAALYAKLPH